MSFFRDFWKKINTKKDVGVSYAGPEPKSLLAEQDLEGVKYRRSKKIPLRDTLYSRHNAGGRFKSRVRKVSADSAPYFNEGTGTYTAGSGIDTSADYGVGGTTTDPFATSSEATIPTLLQMRALSNMATSKKQKQMHKDETHHWRDEDLPSIREMARETTIEAEASTNQPTEKAEHTARWKRCVEHVQEAHPDVNAYAVCTAVLGDESFKSMDDKSFLDEIDKIIRHEGDKWKLYSHKGKLLGTHDTKADAERQERAIMANKAQTTEETENTLAGKENWDRSLKDRQTAVRKAVIGTIDKFIKQQKTQAVLNDGIAKFTKERGKGTYYFTRTITDRYYFNIDADNEEEAFRLFEDMDNSEADAKKNLDSVSALEGFAPAEEEESA
jgi:hypothetical protein